MNTVLKLAISLTILGMVALSLIGFQLAKSPPREKDNEKQIPLVSTYAATKFMGKLDLSVTGEVVPFRVVTKSTEVAGRIDMKSELCRSGRAVTKGEILVQIDETDYQNEIERLQAEVDQSKSMIEELRKEVDGAEKSVDVSKREFELLQKEYERRKELQNSLSKSELATAERNMITAEKAFISANNTLTILEARKARMDAALVLSNKMLTKANTDKERCTIKAPIDGVIVQSDVEQGDYVNKGAALFTIEDTSTSEVLCNLKMEQLDWLWEHRPNSQAGQKRTAYQPPRVPVTIQSEVGEQLCKWNGILDRYDGIGLDDSTKSVPCIIVVDDPTFQSPSGPIALVRGMFVEATVEYKYGDDSAESSLNGLTQFPAGAVQPGNYVWVDDNGKLAKRDVDVVDHVTDEKSNQRFAIVNATGEKSIAPGEMVIYSPIANPTEGAEIRIVTDNEQASEQPTKDKS